MNATDWASLARKPMTTIHEERRPMNAMSGTSGWAIRCTAGPAKGLWWDGGGWCRGTLRSGYPRAVYVSREAAADAVERADIDLCAEIVFVRLREPQLLAV